MPHQCTDCGKTFEDGSKEMLSGCPGCGGNKFQFIPKGATSEPSGSGAASEQSAPEPPSTSSSAGAVSKATKTVREWVGSNSKDSTGSKASSESKRAWPKSGTESYETPAEKAKARSKGESNTSSKSASSASPNDEASASPQTGTDSAANSTSATEASTSAGGDAASRDQKSSTGRQNQQRPPTAREKPQEPPQSGQQSDQQRQQSDPAEDGSIRAKPASDEDNAQASARSDMVSPDELPNTAQDAKDATTETARSPGEDQPPAAAPSEPKPEDGRVVSAPADTEVDDRPDLDELRHELNQQFESIKILNPGQYELNLMELYDRQEYIISLREDGRYVIDVPEAWRGGEE
ncbi:OapC/ArvC family zinc-ribbon domain-containing protein [Haloarchaeobius sp. TZWWS8]|uniref:OapC/ArvC family zinc-ribbon domain-containing protein n=1 Tax=Haloarchaeobius sp. TZWWS8 TaxID=3446121 RepID=UPI003EB9BAB0